VSQSIWTIFNMYVEILHRLMSDNIQFICKQDWMQGAELGDRMQGAHTQLGSHTIQTHGVRLVRKHTHDWVVLTLLATLVIGLHYAPPFKRFVGEDMMTDIRYPVKPSTVPGWAVPVCF
jgi:hypothetical protein